VRQQSGQLQDSLIEMDDTMKTAMEGQLLFDSGVIDK
jgi:hypothetical protein